jgi:protein gp37
MFDNITETWNPVVGCLHSCKYCWARRLAETKLKNIERYNDGFKPKLVEKELNRRFYRESVFVSDMGDLFGDWVPAKWIIEVIEATRRSPTSNFLFLTKNPKRYYEFLDLYPENVVLGVTIETNRDYEVTEAPTTTERYKYMRDLPFKNKVISIEPIMDFDIGTFVQWLREIGPILVHVGYDNYNSSLPEPPLYKTYNLMDHIRVFTRVKTLTLRETKEG